MLLCLLSLIVYNSTGPNCYVYSAILNGYAMGRTCQSGIHCHGHQHNIADLMRECAELSGPAQPYGSCLANDIGNFDFGVIDG